MLTTATTNPDSLVRMDTAPLVSVVVSTCERPEQAFDCVASILNCTFRDFEIVIVDQSPAAGLRARLESSYAGENRIVYRTLDRRSLSAARNRGAQESRGDIVVFVDDDVVVEPGWLQAFRDAFSAVQPPPGVVAGRLDPLWAAPPPAWYPPERMFLLGLYDRGASLMPMPGQDLPIGASFATRREVIRASGPFDERTGFSYARRCRMIGGEDSLFSLRARRAGYSLYYQPAARAYHRISAAKLTRRYFLRRNFWDGYTLLTVLHLLGEAGRGGAGGVIRTHGRLILRLIKRFLQFRPGSDPNATGSRAFMLMLAECASSAGVIRAAIRLRNTGELP